MRDMIFVVAVVLASIGAINWGLRAFMHFDLVERTGVALGIRGLDKVLYGLIALSGVYMLYATLTFLI